MKKAVLYALLFMALGCGGHANVPRLGVAQPSSQLSYVKPSALTPTANCSSSVPFTTLIVVQCSLTSMDGQPIQTGWQAPPITINANVGTITVVETHFGNFMDQSTINLSGDGVLALINNNVTFAGSTVTFNQVGFTVTSVSVSGTVTTNVPLVECCNGTCSWELDIQLNP